jgi:hypothetical protein
MEAAFAKYLKIAKQLKIEIRFKMNCYQIPQTTSEYIGR